MIILSAIVGMVLCVGLAGAILTVRDAQARFNVQKARQNDINTEARLRKRRMD